jgi:hypothetical protein
MRNNVCAYIDRQRVDMVDDNLVIVTEGSPYFGMLVADYREHVCKPWNAELRRQMAEKERLRAEEIKAKGHSDISISLNPRKVNPASLPPWPDGVVNYLLVSTQESDQPGRDLSSGTKG